MDCIARGAHTEPVGGSDPCRAPTRAAHRQPGSSSATTNGFAPNVCCADAKNGCHAGGSGLGRAAPILAPTAGTAPFDRSPGERRCSALSFLGGMASERRDRLAVILSIPIPSAGARGAQEKGQWWWAPMGPSWASMGPLGPSGLYSPHPLNLQGDNSAHAKWAPEWAPVGASFR